MSKAFIYGANTSTQTLTGTNDAINFGKVTRKFGCNLSLDNGSLSVSGLGYYTGTGNVVFRATSTGTLVATWLCDGATIPGATQSYAVANGTIASFNVPFAIREYTCCNPTSTLEFVLSGAEGTVTSAMVIAERL